MKFNYFNNNKKNNFIWHWRKFSDHMWNSLNFIVTCFTYLSSKYMLIHNYISATRCVFKRLSVLSKLKSFIIIYQKNMYLNSLQFCLKEEKVYPLCSAYGGKYFWKKKAQYITCETCLPIFIGKVIFLNY